MAKVVRVTKAMAQAWLADVPEDKRFWCCDGRVLQNLAELEVAVRQMSDETFRYHSNEEKADFSKWVRDVIGDETLSRQLQGSVSRLEAAKRVAARIAWLKSKQ
jgi:hypothetical protein